ncbi:MAG: hypothetical protein ACRDOF_07080 [Gaiellaceae bacterium]
MNRALVLVITTSAAIASGAALSASDRWDEEARGTTDTSGRMQVSSEQQSPPNLKLKPGTRKLLGEFRVGGKKVRLETADSTDGDECLIDTEVEAQVSGSTCFGGGLFGSRRVAFSVNFDGGPGNFRSLYVVGVAAGSVDSVALTRTDGSTVQLSLSRNRGFVFESSASDLDGNVLPAALELIGPSGRLVEKVEIPPLQ